MRGNGTDCVHSLPAAPAMSSAARSTYTVTRHQPPPRRVNGNGSASNSPAAPTQMQSPSATALPQFRSSQLNLRHDSNTASTVATKRRSSEHQHQEEDEHDKENQNFNSINSNSNNNHSAKSNHPQKRISLIERVLGPPRSFPFTAPISVTPTRHLLLEDGSIFSHYSDGCSLLLHPGAATMTQFLPDGNEVVRHMSSCVVSGVKAKWRETMKWRNQVVREEEMVMVNGNDKDGGEKIVDSATYPFARWGVKTLHPSQQGDASSASSLPTSTLTSPSITHLPDGSIRITALEGDISLTLLPNQHWIKLRYPLPLKREVSGISTRDESLQYQYTYFMQERLCPVECVEDRWKFPLECVMKERRRVEEERLLRKQQEEQNISTSSSSTSNFQTPLRSTTLHQPIRPSHFDLIMDLPKVKSLQSSSNSSAASSSVTTSPDLTWPLSPSHSIPLLHSSDTSYPRDSYIPVCETQEAKYFVVCVDRQNAVATGSSRNEADVQVRIHIYIKVDASAMILEVDQFIKHYLPRVSEDILRAAEAQSSVSLNHLRSPREKLYSLTSLPHMHNASGLNLGESTYPLHAIIAVAKKLREHTKHIWEVRLLQQGVKREKIEKMREAQPGLQNVSELMNVSNVSMDNSMVNQSHHSSSSSVPTSTSLFSSTLHERAIRSGIGEFTAFIDGRVKVHFFDRTLLSMNTSRTEVSLMRPDGSILPITIPSLEAKEWERYLLPTLEFAQWAFQTPKEREEYQRRQQLQQEMIQYEIERTKRFLMLQRMARGEETHLLSAMNTTRSVLETSSSYAQIQQQQQHATLLQQQQQQYPQQPQQYTPIASFLSPMITNSSSVTLLNTSP